MTLKARIENGIVYSPYPSEDVPEMSLYQAVKQHLEQHGNRTAVVWENEEITFEDLLKTCQRYAAGFQGHGIKKGDKVLVHLDNSLENLIAIYSVIFAGGVAVLSSPGVSKGDLLYKIQSSNATYILTTASEANRFNDFLQELDMKGYFTVGTAEGCVSVTEFKKLNENMYKEFPVEDVKNEVIMLLYTSGTTGRPKAVEHTHYGIVARLPPCFFTDEDIVASRISIASLLGFRIFLSASYTGTKAVLFSSPASTEEMINAIQKYKVTTVVERYTTILELSKKIEQEGVRLNFVKNVIFTGIKTTLRKVKELEPSFDSSIVKNVYASNEIGWICQPPMGVSKWYGIGFPSPMAQIKIVDIKSGNVLGPNEQGEALVKTPTSMRGYYGNPEATSQAITSDGWARTGDICYYDEDGQFFFVERRNLLLRCNGILVAPSSIESVLLSHEGIVDAAVIGVFHPRYQEVAMACVVLKTSHSTLNEAEIQNFVADQLESNMHLHGGVKFVHAIPRDDFGKIIRKKLREILQVDD
ncbi:4-coumarate--CoA ligase 1 [Ixodes scapularis]